MEKELIKNNLEVIKKIYKKLEDEESKYIFKNRLMYSITSETEYIKNVVRTNEIGKKFSEILFNNEVYLFGAGIWGEEITKIWGDSIKGILDNNRNKWGGKLNDVNIYNPREVLNESFSGKVIISTKKYGDMILKQLLDIGIKKSNIIDINEIITKMEKEQYFSLEGLPHVMDEVFVDVGSLDANTAINFSEWSKDYKKIYCFEPDKENIVKCIDNISKSLIKEKTELIQAGAWNCDGNLYMKSQGNGLSFVSDVNKDQCCDSIKVNKLDTILKDSRVTFMKMDIEGAEFEALQGAKEVIATQKPKLAISVYHKPEDIISLLDLIISYNDSYMFYLRHHSIVSWDTVLYAF